MENPVGGTDAKAETRIAVQRIRIALLVFIHLATVVAVVHAVVTTQQDRFGLLLQIVMGCTVVLACVDDGRVRGTPILPIVQLIMLFTWPVAAPIYLVWSRGWRGILWAMLWIFTMLTCALISGVVAAIVLDIFK